MRQEWASQIQDYKSSSKNMRAFCRERGLSYSSFRYWLQKDKTKLGDFCPPRLLPLVIQPAQDSSMVVRVKGVELTVDADFEPEFLKKVVLTLKEI